VRFDVAANSCPPTRCGGGSVVRETPLAAPAGVCATSVPTHPGVVAPCSVEAATQGGRFFYGLIGIDTVFMFQTDAGFFGYETTPIFLSTTATIMCDPNYICRDFTTNFVEQED
jgi:hypothetical protein